MSCYVVIFEFYSFITFFLVHNIHFSNLSCTDPRQCLSYRNPFSILVIIYLLFIGDRLERQNQGKKQKGVNHLNSSTPSIHSSIVNCSTDSSVTHTRIDTSSHLRSRSRSLSISSHESGRQSHSNSATSSPRRRLTNSPKHYGGLSSSLTG